MKIDKNQIASKEKEDIMVDKVLLKYVEQMYTLESEMYTLCQIKKTLEQEKTMLLNRIQDEKISYSLPQYNKKNIWEYIKGTLLAIPGFFITICFLYLFSASGAEDTFYKIVFASIGVYMLIGGIKIISKAVSDDNAVSNRQKEIIRNAIQKRERIKKENNNIRSKCNKLTENIKKLDLYIGNKYNTMRYMYDFNIIHRNYRNFYCISKIYELIDTGICDSLKGVDGVYSQMRFDQIIDNQKLNIKVQRDILATNRMMYLAITQTDNMLKGISRQFVTPNINMQNLVENIYSESGNAKFLNLCSQHDKDAIGATSEYINYKLIE